MTPQIHGLVLLVVSLTKMSVSKPISRNTARTGRLNIVLPHVLKEYKKNAFHEEKKSISRRGGAGTPISNSVTVGAARNWKTTLVNPVRTKFLQPIQQGLKPALTNFKKNKLQRINFQKKRLIEKTTLLFEGAPRCGVTDEAVKIPHRNAHYRRKRYAIQGSRWPQSVITYNITSYSKKLTKAEVNTTVEKAFRKWAEVIPRVFRWSSNADIEILFAEGTHGHPGRAFTGKGDELAHAFYPQYGGDIHIDDAEAWTTGTPSYGQKNLLFVVTHEIGHSLGLLDSSVSTSIMTDRYPALSTSDVNLDDDDIKGIQSIYGLCTTEFDAIEVWKEMLKTYIFRRDQYWRFDDPNYKTERNYPQPTNLWRGIPKEIDEMLLWGHNWVTYFFKGSKYYRYNDHLDQVAYMRDISDGWPGVPNDIDAAFTHNDLKTYFFKGNFVYQFDNIADKVAKGYPKKISDVFSGLPGNLDTAFRWYYDGKSYFFKGPYFYIWNDTLNRVDGPYVINKTWQNVCNV